MCRVFHTADILKKAECNGGELQRYTYCSSSGEAEGTVVSCPVAGITGITIITSFTLDQQNKTEACVPDDTYGQFGTDRVWVRNGCDAVFVVCGENTATTISETETTSMTSTAAHTTSITGMIYYSKLKSAVFISIMLLCPTFTLTPVFIFPRNGTCASVFRQYKRQSTSLKFVIKKGELYLISIMRYYDLEIGLKD